MRLLLGFGLLCFLVFLGFAAAANLAVNAENTAMVLSKGAIYTATIRTKTQSESPYVLTLDPVGTQEETVVTIRPGHPDYTTLTKTIEFTTSTGGPISTLSGRCKVSFKRMTTTHGLEIADYLRVTATQP